MNKLKIISLTASMVLAMAFIFSCSDDGGGGVTSSSVEDGESSSSEGGEGNSQTYSYCLLSGEKMCLDGPFTSKDCNTAGGYPSNSCPYGGVEPSSSSVDGEQGDESSSSVSGGNQPSSSGNVEQSSSSVGTAQSSSSEETAQSSSSVKKENCGTQEYDPYYNHCYYGTLYANCSWLQQYQSDIKCDGEYRLLQCGVTDEYYNATTEFCQTNLIYPKCNGKTYDASQKCENDVLLTKCGVTDKYYNSAIEFCLDGDIHALCNGSTYNPIVAKCNQNGSAVRNLCSGVEYDPYSQYCANSTVKYKGTFTDERDGNTYTYVTINTQTWMAENLKYNVVGSVCCDNLVSNCEKYGKLYNWATAMAIDMIYNSNSYTAQAKHQGICPSGWHLPNRDEWDKLSGYVDGTNSTTSFYHSPTAGMYLKATSGWNNGNGTDQYGFSALPGGRGDGGFSYVGKDGYWWSTGESGSNNAHGRYMDHNGDYAYWYSISKSILYSVRCLQD
jgi:uncharacterized protein (TIGR02145 family)